MKKFISIGLAAAGILTLFTLVLNSCKKDNPEVTDPLVGKFIISSAVLTKPLIYQGDTILESGLDMTAAINAALLSSADCNNAANTRIELKNNGQIWYLCEGENTGFQNGTWDINTERTELNLALNIPNGSSTVTAQLKIKNLSETSIKVSGDTTIPLPPEFFLVFGVDLTGSGVPVFPTEIHIEITRMP